MRRLLYTTLAFLAVGGCAGNDYYQGKIVDKCFWQDPKGSNFYRLVVNIDLKQGRSIQETSFQIPFNISGSCEFLDSLNRLFNIGDAVQVKGKDLSDRVPTFNGEMIVLEPLIASERLAKVN